MKNILTILAMALSIYSQAQNAVELELWPNGAPNDNGLSGEEVMPDELHVANVSRPTLTIYPAENPNGLVIIQCPGGAYMNLAIQKEGHSMANWMCNQGVTFGVLKYRMPNGHFECTVSDVLQAIRLVREHAGEWKVKKVGVMGCSAGGNLAIQAATQYTGPEDRPDFQVLLYAFTTRNPYIYNIMFGKDASQETIDKYSVLNHVTADTPPAFITCSADDNVVPCDDSIRYFQLLRKYGIEASLHIYPTGSHGWGYSEVFLYKREWTSELEKWLREFNRK